MNKTYLKIAKCIVEFSSKSHANLSHLRDFIVPQEKPDYKIIFLKDNSPDKPSFKERTMRVPDAISIHKLQYVLRELLQDYFERKKDGLILHCSSVIMNGKASLFLGVNGAGKSTISDILGSIYRKVADDSGILMWDKIKKKYEFFQTPFVEKKEIHKTPMGVPIQGVYFLKKSTDISNKPMIDKANIFVRLHAQLFTDIKREKMQLRQLFKFANSEIPFYTLRFTRRKKDLLKWFSSPSRKE